MATPSPSAEAQSFGSTTADAFDILRLEPRFDLEAKLLAERHRTLSLALHPDRFSGRPSAERRLALEQAMRVNSAYRQLRDPVSRAEALAARLQLTLPGETTMSPELLERTMERREQLSEAVLAGDVHQKQRLLAQAKDEQATEETRLAAFFAAASDSAAPSAFASAQTLAEILTSLRFLRRFIEAAEAELEASPA